MQVQVLYSKSMSTGEIPTTTTLPYGYTMVPREEIYATDILNLYAEEPFDYEGTVPVWSRCLRDSIAVVGVGRTDGPDRVTGVGFLAGNARQGLLCDLYVHPNHRHQGLGRLIVQERVRLADEYPVERLLVSIERTNSLKSFYRRLGFEGTGRLLQRTRPQ